MGCNRLKRVFISQALQAGSRRLIAGNAEPREPNQTHSLSRLEAKCTRRHVHPAQPPLLMFSPVKTQPRCRRALRLCCRDDSAEGIARLLLPETGCPATAVGERVLAALACPHSLWEKHFHDPPKHSYPQNVPAPQEGKGERCLGSPLCLQDTGAA